MTGRAGFQRSTTLIFLANGMPLSAGNSRLLPREPRGAVLPPRGRPGALVPLADQKRGAPADCSSRSGPAGAARRVLLQQLKPARWLADNVRKQKLKRACQNGRESDEQRQKRTRMLRTFEPSKMKVRPTTAEMMEVRNAVRGCDMARLRALDLYCDGRLTSASFVAAALDLVLMALSFALVPLRCIQFGYISDSIIERWDATDNLQQVWFSLEQRYCWVPRSELVQQYTEMDGVYKLPKDDLLLD